MFKEWYETRTKHRKLTWIYVLGQCMLSGKFSPKSIELQVSTFQAAALLLFNNDETCVPQSVCRAASDVGPTRKPKALKLPEKEGYPSHKPAF